MYAGYDKVRGFQLFNSDPSGNYAAWKAHATGKGCVTAISTLKDEYKGEVEWTIIRPFRLLDGEKGRYRTALENEYPKEGGSWTWESYTGDVAQFCIDEFNNSNYIRKLVSIGI